MKALIKMAQTNGSSNGSSSNGSGSDGGNSTDDKNDVSKAGRSGTFISYGLGYKRKCPPGFTHKKGRCVKK